MKNSDTVRLNYIITEVMDERHRQDKKWGRPYQNPHKRQTILTEEVGEVAEAILDLENVEAENREDWHLKRDALRAELIQVAAVAIANVEVLDRDEWDWNDCNCER